jgi:membrane fusion protein (multidrug efflux system)
MMRAISTESGMGSSSGALLEIAPMENREMVAEGPGQALVFAQTRAPNTAQQAPGPAPGKPGGGRKLIAVLVAALLLGAGGYYGYNWWTTGRFMVSTDDAYVAADAATIAPKVAGYIKSVPVAENSHVKAGDPLVILDDADFRIAVQQAEAQIATATATVARVQEQIGAGEAQIAQAQAQIASAKAVAANAKAQFDRVSTLAGKSFASNEAVDGARTALVQAQAAEAAAEAGLTAAEANIAVVTAQRTEAEHAVEQYRLARDQAALNLDHTIVRATYDGVVGNRAAQPGEFVQPGQRLMAVVPLDAIYVEANFKETQLVDLKPGQRVAISIDAYPDLAIEGTVESFAPASGAVFSLLPADNATGNFTKIVQRVAVHIRVAGEAVSEGLIRPGMSVVAAVDTRTAPKSVAAR